VDLADPRAAGMEPGGARGAHLSLGSGTDGRGARPSAVTWAWPPAPTL